MKVYILDIDEKFRPKKQGFVYPIHNKDYGVEQDFFEYLQKNKDLLTGDPSKADWHYLPVFWTRWFLNHNYAKVGNDMLQDGVSSRIIDDKKTFTICQYDDGPMIDLGSTVQFLASRKTQKGIDIPLLSEDHRKPFFMPRKNYLASFVGNLNTHEIRGQMKDILSSRNNILIENGNFGKHFFEKTTYSSYVCLAPRGYGGSSFRFFEAMQMGIVPFLIGDIDTRPFKDEINWDDISLHCSDFNDIERILSMFTTDQLINMGKSSQLIYNQNLKYGKWCNLVIKKLKKM